MRTYKRKLKLTSEQDQRISSWIGVCRLVYNMGLEIKKKTYEVTGKSIHKFELQKQLVGIKHIDWVRDVPTHSLQKVILRLDNSFNRFFKTYKTGGGYPKFASKKSYKSITFPDLVAVAGNTVRLPKIGWLKMFNDSPVLGDIKMATIIKEPTGYFICIVCDNVPPKFTSENQTIGLDMGISHFCVDSNGHFIANPQHFKKHERRLRIENRSLARKKKLSRSWKKQVKRLSILHHKIKNVRRDFLQKESTKIAMANSLVVLEDLNVAGMSKNNRLSRHILDCGWGMFRAMLDYKTTVIAVNPSYTSQTCSVCGCVDKMNRQSQSAFCCVECGHQENADYNGAKNILRKGIPLERQRKELSYA